MIILWLYNLILRKLNMINICYIILYFCFITSCNKNKNQQKDLINLTLCMCFMIKIKK